MKGKRAWLVSVLVLTLVSFSVFLIATSKLAYADAVTIQPSSADSCVSEYLYDFNLGTYIYLYVRSLIDFNYRSLVQFNLSAIPSGVTIHSAQMKLYMWSAPSESRTYEAYRINSSWTETGVTWENQPTLEATPTASVSTGITSGVWLSWDITSDAQAWVSGSAPNYGTLIKDAAEGNATSYSAYFRSKEFGTADLRPKLEVTYSAWGFSVSASPDIRTIMQGQSTNYTITVTLISGSPQTVSLSLSDQPENTTYNFDPASGTPTPTFESTLTVNTTASTPTGTYILTITGTEGGSTNQTTATLEVISAPDFRISATPPSQTVSSGASTTYTVTLTSLAGFSEPVSLNVTGVPTGATGTFDPTTVIPTPTGNSSILTVSTTPTTPGGEYTLTITGSGGEQTHSTTVELVVVGPESFIFQVRPGTAQIVVTIIWPGQGTATIQLQSPTTTYTEEDMTIYEKTTINVASNGTKTYTGIKTATCPIPTPSTTESWTLLLWLSGITEYQVNIECEPFEAHVYAQEHTLTVW